MKIGAISLGCDKNRVDTEKMLARLAAAGHTIVPTEDDNLVTHLGLAFQAVAACAVADTTSEHDHLVIAVFLTVLLMLKR